MNTKIVFALFLLCLFCHHLKASIFSPSFKNVDLCLTAGNSGNTSFSIDDVGLQATSSGTYRFKIVRSGDFIIQSGLQLNGVDVDYIFPPGSNTAFSVNQYFLQAFTIQDIFVQIGTPGPYTAVNLNAQVVISLVNFLGQDMATLTINATTRSGAESIFTVNGSNAMAPTLIQTYSCQGIPLSNQSTGDQYLMELVKTQANGTGNLGTFLSNGGAYSPFSTFPSNLASTSVFGGGFVLSPGYYLLKVRVKRADNICGTSLRTAFIKVNTNDIPLNFPNSSNPWPMVLMNPKTGTSGLEGTFPGSCQYPQTDVGSVTCGFNVYDLLQGVTSFTQLRFSLGEAEYSHGFCSQITCGGGSPCPIINYSSSWLNFTYNQLFNFNAFTSNWFQNTAAVNPTLFANRTFVLTVSFRNPSIPCHAITGRQFYFKIPAANLGLKTAQGGDPQQNGLAGSEDLVPSIYPNPTKGECTVDLKALGAATVQVHDLYGKSIMAAQASTDHRLVLDLSNHPAGIYFVTVQSAQGSKTLRVVRQ
jgi:hypothetical protein